MYTGSYASECKHLTDQQCETLVQLFGPEKGPGVHQRRCGRGFLWNQRVCSLSKCAQMPNDLWWKTQCDSHDNDKTEKTLSWVIFDKQLWRYLQNFIHINISLNIFLKPFFKVKSTNSLNDSVNEDCHKLAGFENTRSKFERVGRQNVFRNCKFWSETPGTSFSYYLDPNAPLGIKPLNSYGSLYGPKRRARVFYLEVIENLSRNQTTRWMNVKLDWSGSWCCKRWR